MNKFKNKSGNSCHSKVAFKKLMKSYDIEHWKFSDLIFSIARNIKFKNLKIKHKIDFAKVGFFERT